ncbi:MAG TPA: hypothetical protein VNS08_02605 [Ureibacillus sp.]|nr:hypothetical protein [Ureibacillus sp.]
MGINIYKAAIGSFIMPVFTALFAIFMPDVHTSFNYIIMAVFVVNIVSFLAMLAIFKKKKRPNAARLVILFNMLAFSLFFTFPLIKALIGQTFLQLILFILFFVCIGLAIYDQKQEVPLVLPPKESKGRKFVFVFYVIPVLMAIIAGGGNFIIVREITNFLGQGYVTYVGGVCLYVLGCWFAFFLQSLFYQGFTKNGVWVK